MAGDGFEKVQRQREDATAELKIANDPNRRKVLLREMSLLLARAERIGAPFNIGKQRGNCSVHRPVFRLNYRSMLCRIFLATESKRINYRVFCSRQFSGLTLFDTYHVKARVSPSTPRSI